MDNNVSDDVESYTRRAQGKAKALPPVAVHFLGTCSGGGPVTSRNCSSLAVDFGNVIWLFDAADATHSRLHQSSLKMSNITRLFITHLHADHVLGLVPVLTTIMSGVGTKPEELERLKAQGRDKKVEIHIYGPVGLRKLIRTTLEITHMTLSGVFAVHEMILSGSSPSVTCNEEELLTNEGVGTDFRADEDGVWPNIVVEGNGRNAKGWSVSAGPIEHRVPTLGYILQEPIPREALPTNVLSNILKKNASALAALDPPVLHPLSLLSHMTSLPPPPPYTLPSGETLHPPGPSGIPPRKLVIFGDCNGGTKNQRFREMCRDPSLLVHECTNGAIPERIQRGEKGRKVRVEGMEHSLVRKKEHDSGQVVGQEEAEHGNQLRDGEADRQEEEARAEREKKKIEEVRGKAQSRGHSTPADVGEFARDIGAKRVVINHFSAAFPSPKYASSEPYPQLCMPKSPYPYPTPYPIFHASDPQPDPLPLTGPELHLRIIMQSLANQVDRVWNTEDSPLGRTVPAREFMIFRLPSHEITMAEMSLMHEATVEAEWVERDWTAHGGVWVGKEGEKVWVGVEEPPSEAEV